MSGWTVVAGVGCGGVAAVEGEGVGQGVEGSMGSVGGKV